MGTKPDSVLPTVPRKKGILSRPLLKVRNPAFQVGNRGFKSPGRDHMSSSSNRLGNQPLTLVIGVRAPKRMPIGLALKSPFKKTNAGFEPCPLSSAKAIKLKYLPFETQYLGTYVDTTNSGNADK